MCLLQTHVETPKPSAGSPVPRRSGGRPAYWTKAQDWGWLRVVSRWGAVDAWQWHLGAGRQTHRTQNPREQMNSWDVFSALKTLPSISAVCPLWWALQSTLVCTGLYTGCQKSFQNQSSAFEILRVYRDFQVIVVGLDKLVIILETWGDRFPLASLTDGRTGAGAAAGVHTWASDRRYPMKVDLVLCPNPKNSPNVCTNQQNTCF